MRVSALVLAVSIAAFAAGCPKPPAALLPAIESQDDVAALRDAFNTDAAHRRLLVLLSPT